MCGFQKSADGKIINSGHAVQVPIPVPVPVSGPKSAVLPVRASNVRPASRDLDRTVLDNSSRLLLKRKDQNISIDEDDDDDDDEDADDSMAYSKYVQDRLNGQEKTSSAVTEKEKHAVGRLFEGKKSSPIDTADTVIAGRSGKVLTALLTVSFYLYLYEFIIFLIPIDFVFQR